MKYRIKARSWGHRGPWWNMAAFRFHSEALEYWNRICVPNECTTFRLYCGRNLEVERMAPKPVDSLPKAPRYRGYGPPPYDAATATGMYD